MEKETDYSLLENAIRKHNIEEVKKLISNGVDTNAKGDSFGTTPLMIASGWGCAKIIKLLLSAGANIHATDEKGDGALIKSYTKQIADMLIKAGAKTSPEIKFILACRFGEYKKVKEALKAGIPPDTKNNWGDTALMETSHAQIANLLIDSGANVNARSEFDWTPLMRASVAGYTNIVKILISSGSDVNQQRKVLKTEAIHYARNTQITKMLIEAGAKVNSKDHMLRTPLHYARNGKIAKILIDAGANVNAMDLKKRTPLIRAAEFKGIDLVKVLIETGADINKKDEQSFTALMWAKKKKKYKIAKLLQAAGAVA